MRVNVIRPGLVDTELVGFVTAGGPVLAEAIEALLTGKPIAPEETEVQGCSIKWR